MAEPHFLDFLLLPSRQQATLAVLLGAVHAANRQTAGALRSSFPRWHDPEPGGRPATRGHPGTTYRVLGTLGVLRALRSAAAVRTVLNAGYCSVGLPLPVPATSRHACFLRIRPGQGATAVPAMLTLPTLRPDGQSGRLGVARRWSPAAPGQLWDSYGFSLDTGTVPVF